MSIVVWPIISVWMQREEELSLSDIISISVHVSFAHVWQWYCHTDAACRFESVGQCICNQDLLSTLWMAMEAAAAAAVAGMDAALG